MDKINRILNINGFEIQYEIARSKRAKRMRIEVRSNKLRASIPMRQNIKDIEKFIALNKNWIARRIQTSTTELITHEAFVFADYAKVKKHAFDLISDRLEIFNLHYKLKWQKIRIKNPEINFFIWAVLNDRIEIAIILLSLVQNQLAFCLIGSIILKKLSQVNNQKDSQRFREASE